MSRVPDTIVAEAWGDILRKVDGHVIGAWYRLLGEYHAELTVVTEKGYDPLVIEAVVERDRMAGVAFDVKYATDEADLAEFALMASAL